MRKVRVLHQQLLLMQYLFYLILSLSKDALTVMQSGAKPRRPSGICALCNPPPLEPGATNSAVTGWKRPG
jgi:hypothetical protein